MSAVFTKTAKSSAAGSFGGASIVAIVGCSFFAVFWLKDDIGVFFQGLLIVGSALCLLWAQSLLRNGMRYLQSGRDWRVEVSGRKLSWQSPVQEIMRSFELPFSNIKTLRHVRTRVGTKGARYSNAYTIELHKGETIKLSDQISGINPEEVFDAMHAKGVPLVKEVIRTKEQRRQKRREKHALREEAAVRQ